MNGPNTFFHVAKSLNISGSISVPSSSQRMNPSAGSDVENFSTTCNN